MQSSVNTSFLKDQRCPHSIPEAAVWFLVSAQALINLPWHKNKHTICSNWVDNSICYAALICFWAFIFEVHALKEFSRLFLSMLGCLQAPPTKREHKGTGKYSKKPVWLWSLYIFSITYSPTPWKKNISKRSAAMSWYPKVTVESGILLPWVACKQTHAVTTLPCSCY